MIHRFFLALALCAASFGALAGNLTPAQIAILRPVVLTEPTLATARQTGDDAAIAAWCNATATPAFIVWRTNVTRSEVYHQTSAEATTWNWTTYKNQGATEQNAWVQMFMGDVANMALPNLRAGVAAIFTGSAQANAQRDHVLAVGKRSATRAEKALAAGTGSTAVPATMAWESTVTTDDASLLR